MSEVEKKILLEIGDISKRIEECEILDLELLVERGKLYLKLERRDLALNDFNRVVAADEHHVEASSYIMLITSIDNYFYNQIYNV